MDHDDYLAALRLHGAAFADTAAGNLTADVPSCPGWNVADLVWHLGEVHHFWGTIAAERHTDPDAVAEPARVPDDEVLDWYRERFGRLLTVLTDTDPSTEVWTWAPQPQQNVGFIARRMALETLVHRWDAEAAAGGDLSIEPGLAVDGVDEFLDFYTTWVRQDAEPVAGTIHLHATDVGGGGEWQIDATGDDLIVTREHGKGDAAVRGRAADLLLLLWRRGRPDDPAFEVFGDRAVLDRLLARTDQR